MRSRKQRLQSPSVHKEDPAPPSCEHPRTNDWVQVDGGPLASLGHVFATMEKGGASRMREGAINIHKQIGSKTDDKVVSIALGTTLFSSRSLFISMSLGTKWLNGSRQFRKIKHLEVNSLWKVQR